MFLVAFVRLRVASPCLFPAPWGPLEPCQPEQCLPTFSLWASFLHCSYLGSGLQGLALSSGQESHPHTRQSCSGAHSSGSKALLDRGRLRIPPRALVRSQPLPVPRFAPLPEFLSQAFYMKLVQCLRRGRVTQGCAHFRSLSTEHFGKGLGI